MCVYTKEWAICTCKPETHLHSSSPVWVCWSYQELCFYLAWGSLQIHNLLFPALQISFPPLFSSFLLLFSFLRLLLNLLVSSEAAFFSLPLLFPCSSLLLSLSDFHIFPSAVTISSFLTWKRHIAKHPIWCVNRKWEDKWCTTAIDWFRLCMQTSTSRVAGWKQA